MSAGPLPWAPGQPGEGGQGGTEGQCRASLDVCLLVWFAVSSLPHSLTHVVIRECNKHPQIHFPVQDFQHSPKPTGIEVLPFYLSCLGPSPWGDRYPELCFHISLTLKKTHFTTQ